MDAGRFATYTLELLFFSLMGVLCSPNTVRERLPVVLVAEKLVRDVVMFECFGTPVRPHSHAYVVMAYVVMA